jgi:hypothetical protein
LQAWDVLAQGGMLDRRARLLLSDAREILLLHGFRHLQHISEHAITIQVLRHYT